MSKGFSEGNWEGTKREWDNKAIISLLAVAATPFPATNLQGSDHAIWATNLTVTVDADFGTQTAGYKSTARQHYAQEGGLEKNDLFMADWLSVACADGITSNTLAALCTAILTYAKSEAVI
jgi:putative ATP-dependent endonuclease of OLD family